MRRSVASSPLAREGCVEATVILCFASFCEADVGQPFRPSLGASRRDDTNTIFFASRGYDAS